MFEYLIVLLLCGVIGVGVCYMAVTWEHRILLRLPTLIGSLMIIVSFFWLPWIHFALFELLPYSETKALLEGLFSVAGPLLDFLGQDPPYWVEFILNTEITGSILLFAIPNSAVWLRLVIGGVVAIGIAGVLWSLLSTLLAYWDGGTRVRQIGSFLMGVAASSMLVCLITQLPELDAWGTYGTLWVRMLAGITGARIAWGLWVSVAGLILLLVGSIMEQVVAPSIQKEIADEYYLMDLE